MYKALKPALLIILLSVCFVISAYAQKTIGIDSLINHEKDYNNKTVTVEGEAIGEVLERGDYAWVNINDGTNAIGIWMTESDAKKIEYFGDYKHVGDTLRRTGIFSDDSKAHGGDVDIHAASMDIIKKGSRVDDTVSNSKAITAAILFCSASIVAYAYFRIVKKVKR